MISAVRDELRQAYELATRAVARAPGWPRAWFCRGYVRECQRRFDAALTAFGRALSLDPCDAEALAYTGHIHFLMGRLEEMQAPLQHALALSPRDPGVGLWHHFLGQYDFWYARDGTRDPSFRASDRSFSQPGLLCDLPSGFACAGGSDRGGTKVAHSWCEAMGGYHITIDGLRARVFSDNPTYLAVHERHYRGLRLIVVAEH